MTILEITGSLELIFTTLKGKPVSDVMASTIIERLQVGAYAISLSKGIVVDSENLEPVYNFTFEVLDDTEYTFVEEKED